MAFSIWAWPLQVRESHRSKLAAATSIPWIRAKNSPKMLSAERELRQRSEADRRRCGSIRDIDADRSRDRSFETGAFVAGRHRRAGVEEEGQGCAGCEKGRQKEAETFR